MKIVIIGNGIAGVTAARHIRKRDTDAQITIISKESKYFFSRTALMYIYMGHMKYEHTKPYEDHFWEENRIDLLQDSVENINFDTQELNLAHSDSIYYDQLILATGSRPNKFGWPGQDLDGVGVLYSLQDLEYLENLSPRINQAVVVGGGLIGVELVEMLRSRDIETTFLIREDTFWGSILSKQEGEMLKEHFSKDHHVNLKFNSNLEEIFPDEKGRVKKIRIKETGEEIPCQYVGLTAGVSPNISFLKDAGLELDKGVLVDEFLRTNIPNVFAIGDCAQLKNPPEGRRSIEAVWYVGRMMGETVANTVCGIPTKYTPGPWFNSAKFMDIEYQTYGDMPVELAEGQKEFYWQHPSEYIAIRMVYEEKTMKFLGINNFGLRLRHHHFNHWLLEGATVEEVLTHLPDANFDPELYEKHEKKILEAFNKENGTQYTPKKKSWKRMLSILTR